MTDLIKPYVYKITYKTGAYYYGYREKNNVPAKLDIGTKYFTSSSKIKELGFENTKIEIIEEFDDGDDAYISEQLLIMTHWDDPLLLNENYLDVTKFKKFFKTKRGSENFRTGKTLEEILGVETAMKMKAALSAARKGKKRTSEVWNKGKKMPNGFVEKRLATLYKNRPEDWVSPIKGRKESVENRNKKSEAHMGERNHMYGKNHSPETIEKIRIKSLGRKISKKTIQKRSETNKDKSIIIWYHNEFGEFTGRRSDLIEKFIDQHLSSGSLGKLILGEHSQHKGWTIK